MDKLDLFEINESNYFHVVCKNYQYFRMVLSLKKIAKFKKVAQYKDHDKPCCSSKNDKGTRL